MRLHSDTLRNSAFLRYLPLPACPYCREKLLAPILSQLIDGEKIRHHWSCESCGGVSQTSVPLPH